MSKQAMNKRVTQALHKTYATLDEIARQDSDGKPFVSLATLKAARHWCEHFLLLVGEAWREPIVSVDECAVITLTWTHGNKTLTVWIDADEVMYTRRCGTEPGYMDMVSDEEWRRIWTWLHAPHRYAEGDVVYARSHGSKRTGVIKRLFTSSPNRETYDVAFEGEIGPEIGCDTVLCSEPQAVVREGRSYYPYVVVGVENLVLAE